MCEIQPGRNLLAAQTRRTGKDVLKYSMSQNWSEGRGDIATGLTARQSETKTRGKKAIGGCGAYLYLKDIVLA